MGCCQSSSLKGHPSHGRDHKGHGNSGHINHHSLPSASNGGDAGAAGAFCEFSLAELRAATNNFSPEYIVSESGEKAPNVVYKGRLQSQNSRRWIAVKKFAKLAWPDPKQFAVSVVYNLLCSMDVSPSFLGFRYRVICFKIGHFTARLLLHAAALMERALH